MDVVTTSLEALIQRVTNPQNTKPDIAAIEAFCVMITKEVEGVQIGTKLLASYIQSSTESEAMQALALLDICMRRCGPSFHTEIGKFRFLNEMIRLVSPKYFGNKTSSSVRQKVLHLLYAWTKEYPRETKIKEAYDMLRKQGVIEEDLASVIENSDDSNKSAKPKSAIFEDEEKSKLLQKLLQSKNPDDLHAANRLIKTMVKEDERRVQMNSRRTMELESVHNNVKLLSEMLDSYNVNETSTEDVELMKELYQSCQRLKSIVLRLANEAQDNEEMLGDVLSASDELSQVNDKYTAIMILGQSVKSFQTFKTDINNTSLLDLSSPIENTTESNLTKSLESNTNTTKITPNLQSDIEALGDIFSTLNKPTNSDPINDNNLLLGESTIMQPINVTQTNKKSEEHNKPEKFDAKVRALEELNELSENLLKQSLSTSTKCRPTESNKVPLNSILTKIQTNYDSKNSLSLNHSSNNLTQPNSTIQENFNQDKNEKVVPPNKLFNCDDTLVDISIRTIDKEINNKEVKTEDTKDDAILNINENLTDNIQKEIEIKPLTDIHVNLQDIQPGIIPPMTVIDEKNSITVVLHFAKDSPRPDVSVVVITTMSKNAKPLSNYLFQAVVPKTCKCRLQTPSGTELPAHNPFLPPLAITQIMLIANPCKEPVSLKFMLSYTMDDETFTEMGEVDKLPHL